MKNIIAVGLAALVLVSACANETVTGTDGEIYKVVHKIKFNGVATIEGGLPRLTFTLTNSTTNTLCFSKFSPSRHYGQIDYFLEDGTSYQNTVSFSHWAPILNWPIDEVYEPSNSEHLIVPGAQFEIVRILTPAVYKSDANVDMASSSTFDGAFEGQTDLFAELGVYLNTCDIRNPADQTGAELFLFKSRRVGPLRVSIPAD